MDESALFCLTHGIYVLGAKDEAQNRFCGSIVDGVMQVANKPLIIALSCHNRSYTKECIEKNKEFSISVISKNVDPFVVANFGFQTSRTVDKWALVDYIEKDGLPYLKGNLAEIKAQVIETKVFDSNTLFLAEVKDCQKCEIGEPLTYGEYRAYFKDEVMKSFNNYRQQQEKEKQNG